MARSRRSTPRHLADLTGVTYQGTLNFNGSDVLTVTTNDLGNTGAPGALTDSDTIAITVSAVNDGPTNTVPGAQSRESNVAVAISGIQFRTLIRVRPMFR